MMQERCFMLLSHLKLFSVVLGFIYLLNRFSLSVYYISDIGLDIGLQSEWDRQGACLHGDDFSSGRIQVTNR